MVSVCPGGQVLLTCERITGSILYWDIYVPMATPLGRIVLSLGPLLSPEFRIGFTEFNITRTSDGPLTSQLLISNVTTNINIYCSDDGNVNNSPMTVIHKGVFVYRIRSNYGAKKNNLGHDLALKLECKNYTYVSGGA